jgi:hypothetical protein
MRPARAAAVLTWINAAGFGLPAVPVAVYVERTGTLPWLGDLFPMYGGPWSDRVTPRTLVPLLVAFAAVNGLVAVVAWRAWSGSRTATRWSLLLIPVEAVFWYGFALPFAWANGVARAVLLVLALRQRAAAPSGRP